MFFYSSYDPISGQISDVYQFSDKATYEMNVSNIPIPFVDFFVEGASHYLDVITLETLARPNMPTTLNGLILIDVPPNSEITIENETYSCPDGGDVTLNFQHPGTYIVKVSCFPYLDKEFEIDYQP